MNLMIDGRKKKPGEARVEEVHNFCIIAEPHRIVFTIRKLTHDEIAKHRFSLDELSVEPRNPIYVLLDNIRNLYNVGPIFRTSDGARISKLILSGYTSHPPRKEYSKDCAWRNQLVKLVFDIV